VGEEERESGMRVRLPEEERKAKAKAQGAAWRKANPEKVRASKAANRAAHLEHYRATRRERYLKNRGHEIKMALAYQAAHPEKAKEYTDKWRAANPDKVRAYLKARYAANPDRVKAFKDAWREANPGAKRIHERNRRARKNNNGGELSSDICSKLLILQRGKCAVCKKGIKRAGFHLDHIIPLSRGGKNSDGNTQLTCPTCNMKKGGKDPIAFMQSLGYLL
jgi:5-methylcytosine-specific restriction endonuclease McrA